MKWLLLISFICLSRPAFSQSLLDSIPFDTSGYGKYENVIEIKGTKAELFDKGKLWLAEAFKDGDFAIQNEDKEAGTVVGTSKLSYPFTYTSQTKKNKVISYPAVGKASFTLKLFFKDDKFKYIITGIKTSNDLSYFTKEADFNRPAVAAATTGKEAAASINLYRGLNDSFRQLTDGLIKVMTTKSESDF